MVSYYASYVGTSYNTVLTEAPPVSVVTDSGGEEIRVDLHPEKPEWLRLNLPWPLVSRYLSTVKNIHGRRWDPKEKVWEIPYTLWTLRFLERNFGEAVHITFTPGEHLPERLKEEATGQARVKVTLYLSEGSELRLQAPAADPRIRLRSPTNLTWTVKIRL